MGDYHRLCRAFERTGLDDVSGDRVSGKLYEQVHTIARNAAARRAQMLQGVNQRFGGGVTTAPAVSAAAEFPEFEREPTSLEDFASTHFRVPPYIVGQLASRALGLNVTKFLRSKRQGRRKSPAEFVLGARADGRHLFYLETRKSAFTWRAESELDQQQAAMLAQYRELKLEPFAFRASPAAPTDMCLKESSVLRHLLANRYDVGKAAGQTRSALYARSRRSKKKARRAEEATPKSKSEAGLGRDNDPSGYFWQRRHAKCYHARNLDRISQSGRASQ